jgi:hypothetical protein
VCATAAPSQGPGPAENCDKVTRNVVGGLVQPPASVNRAEVERARKLIAETCTGCVVSEIDTVEDKIVYDGADHLEFVSSFGLAVS